jgi:hypothetical protein
MLVKSALLESLVSRKLKISPENTQFNIYKRRSLIIQKNLCTFTAPRITTMRLSLVVIPHMAAVTCLLQPLNLGYSKHISLYSNLAFTEKWFQDS